MPLTLPANHQTLLWLLIVALLPVAVWRLAGAKRVWKFSRSGTHGTARWASLKDVRRAGLLAGRGVYVGTCQGRYLRAGSDQHVFVLAPTGSGKSVGPVLCTLLSYPESVVVWDIKGELWAKSAGWRSQHAHNRVLRFEPAHPSRSCRFNLLDAIRAGTRFEVGDAQNLAMGIVEPSSKGPKDFWDKSSYTLLTGCILHLCHQARKGGPPATLPELGRMLSSPGRSVDELWEEMAKSSHPVVASAAQDMLDRQGAPAEASGIVSTAKESLSSLFRDPVVARNVSGSDFLIEDLVDHASPVSLYVVTEGDDQVRMTPLVRMLFNLLLRRLAGGLEGEAVQKRHRLLLMIDEFPTLRLPLMAAAIAYIRAYGLQAFLVAQNYGQLHAAYGQDEPITANCGVFCAFPPAPSDQKTAKYLSELTGVTTVERQQVTHTRQGVSRTRQESARPLMTPDEVRTMRGPQKDAQDRIVRPGEMLIFAQGQPPIRGTQPLYFADPAFAERAAIPAPKQSDALPRLPGKPSPLPNDDAEGIDAECAGEP